MDLKLELLNYYNLTANDLSRLNKEVCLSDIPLFFNNNDINKAIERITKAIINEENILIYGDYDCDGIMATSILYKTLLKMNAKVSKYIPSRYLDGYGLTKEKVELSKDKYSLIITVDNGIAAIEACDKAKEIGIDVIVTDHHDVQEKLPDAYVIIHPELSKLADIKISGGLVSYFLSSSLLKKHDEYLLTLAAISTISDLMPLKDLNRDLVKLAIKFIKQNKYPSIMNLLDDSSFKDEKDIGMVIAPKINAVGRMNEDARSVNLLVNYFVTSKLDLIKSISKAIENTNENRKLYTKNVVSTLKDYSSASAISCLLEVKEGLLGLVATRLLTQYNVPVAVFTTESHDSTLLKASLRSKHGCNLSEFLSSLDFLVAYGGHSQAAGVTIKATDLEKFKNAFSEYAKNNPFRDEIKSIKIELNDVNLENLKIINSFAPFGKDFEEPNFKLNLNVKTLKFTSNKKHIINLINQTSRIIYFNADKDNNISLLGNIDFIGNIRSNSFNGRNFVDFVTSKTLVDENA